MAELKTQKTNKSVKAFIKTIDDPQKQKDCFDILEIMEKETGSKPFMWGGNIVGFGKYHYTYASGREGDWFLCGFSPRKANISVYLCMCDLTMMGDLLKKLGTHKTGKSCLYIKRLSDINMSVFKKLVKKSLALQKKNAKS